MRWYAVCVVACLLSIPAGAAQPSGDQYYTAPANVSGLYIDSSGSGSECEAIDVITVDYYADTWAYYSYLELSGLFPRCGWAYGSDGLLATSVDFDVCYNSGDETHCYRSWCDYAYEYGHSCTGHAIIYPDGSVWADGYDYYEDYDANGDYAGSSGWSWEVQIDASDALPVTIPAYL